MTFKKTVEESDGCRSASARSGRRRDCVRRFGEVREATDSTREHMRNLMRFLFVAYYVGSCLDISHGLFPHQGAKCNARIKSGIYNPLPAGHCRPTLTSLLQMLARALPVGVLCFVYVLSFALQRMA